jgi:hypothetical protein
MQVPWAQILKAQCLAPELFRQKSPHDGEIAHDRRAGQATLRAQESLIVPEELVQRRSVYVWWRQRRNDTEAAQEREHLPAGGHIATPACVATVRVKLGDPRFVKSGQRRSAVREPVAESRDPSTLGSNGLRGVPLASEEPRKSIDVRGE